MATTIKRMIHGVVTALIFGGGWAIAQDGHKWVSLHADDGSVVNIDMTSLYVFNANATTKAADVALSFPDGKPYPLNMRRLIFYCGQGSYKDVTEGVRGPLLYSRQGSVADRVSRFVCAGAGPTIVDQLKRPSAPAPAPKWQDYCKGFSDETCGRMRRVVENKVTPDYCKPGFGIAPSKLSDEQLRICYVMPPLQVR
jgi:hypothetical protein